MPIVRSVEIKERSLGNDAMRVHIGMTFIVMQLDVFEIARFLHPWLLIQVFEIITRDSGIRRCGAGCT
jgi:hypothetical protein